MINRILLVCVVIFLSLGSINIAFSMQTSSYDAFSGRSTEIKGPFDSLDGNVNVFNLFLIEPVDSLGNATVQLEKQLRKYGYLGNILKYAPEISSKSPDDFLVRYLYSIALAADGDIKNAKATFQSAKPNPKNQFYKFMATAMIAKAEKKYKTAKIYATRAKEIDSNHPYIYNILGRVDLEQNKLDSALRNFKKAVLLSPDFYSAYSNIGVVLFSKGELFESAKYFQKAIKIVPENCAALIGHAIVAENLNNTNVAINDLNNCKGNHKLALVAKRNLVSLYVKRNQLDKAEKKIREIGASDPNFVNANLGLIYLRQGKAKKANASLKKIKTDTSEKYYLLSLSEFLMGNVQQSISLSEKALKTGADFPGAIIINGLLKSYATGKFPNKFISKLRKKKESVLFSMYLKANEYAANGDYSKALESWKKSEGFFRGFSVAGLKSEQLIKGFHKKESSFLNLGVLFYVQKFHKSALSEFKKALEVNHDSLFANYYVGLLYSDMGDIKNTRKYFQRALSVSPNFFSANYALAENYISEGNQELAIKYYTFAKETKSDVGVLVKLGLLYEQRNLNAKAENAYNEIISNFPDLFLGYNQLAWLYAKQNIKNVEALSLAEKANKLKPNNISILDTLGWIHANNNQLKTALRYLKKATQLSGNKNPDVLYHLAYVQNKLGDKISARKNIENALSLSSSFEMVKQAKELFASLQ